ncbi:transcriptional regulator with XRE-family HTH domain [Kribbella aluminosa]|uniref:Transcriptional regulator with XRE-family HTH domain n=1 Tax=Kribbella aluminosa TaxID=416017 RepID=A0ABS4UUD0_9ACTN|nr:helix-turn-helix domain-containing protein [Kribbella aluminosa]MBP2355164.1 transcriptional regulator with XRE-family HTH domain [Kribbella aluminosa]
MQDVEGFAAALQRVRRHAAVTYRELAQRAHYSHPHLIRATSGKQLPTWEVAAAFLGGCGVPADLMPVWRRRWDEASRDPRDVVSLLDKAESLEQLGAAVAALAQPRSLRALEQETGIPRATIQAWLRGTRAPGRDRLDHLVRTVGATAEERTAVARTLDRLSASEPARTTTR